MKMQSIKKLSLLFMHKEVLRTEFIVPGTLKRPSHPKLQARPNSPAAILFSIESACNP